MKNRILTLILLFMVSIITVKAETPDYLYLNSGNIVKGKILTSPSENGATISIKCENGEIYEYNKSEIRKISNDENYSKPESVETKQYEDYTKYETGFWYTIETNAGYSINVEDKNIGFVDVDVVGGYRFNEYLRLGLGLGARCYINNDVYRKDNVDWAFPVFLNVRGNIISSKYRSIVPFYSFDIGGACRDGFMMRPTIGVRFGEPRSAFILGLSYMGQSVKGFRMDDLGDKVKKNKFTSFMALKIGYEF